MVKAVVLFIFLSMLHATWGAVPQMFLSVDNASVPFGETVQLSIRFRDFPGTPRVDEMTFDGFEVLDRNTSTSISITNGVQQKTLTVSFLLRPRNKGDFSIGPYEVEYNQQTIRSNVIKVHVGEGGDTSVSADVFVKAEVSKPEVYFGEQFFYTLDIYRAEDAQIGNLSLELPDFSGFISETDSAKQSTSQTVVDGRLFQKTEVVVPLFAVKKGIQEIGAGSVSFVVPDRRRRRRDFFDMLGSFGGLQGTRKKAYSAGVSLNIKELPSPRPDQFSGLVGRFNLEADLSSKKLKTGGNATLTVTVTGIGSLQDFKGFTVEPEGFKVYQDGNGELEERRTRDGYVGGVKKIQYALIPQIAGDHELGPFELVYFDPDSKKYNKASTKKISVHVEQGKAEKDVFVGGDSYADKKARIEVLKKEILPIFTKWEDSANHWVMKKRSFLLFFAGMILLFLVIKSYLTMRRERMGDPVLMRYRSSWSVFLSSMEEAKPSEYSALFLDFVQAKLKEAQREWTPEEMLKSMESRVEISSNLTTKVKKMFEMDTMARYGGGQAGLLKEEQWKKLANEIHKVL